MSPENVQVSSLADALPWPAETAEASVELGHTESYESHSLLVASTVCMNSVSHGAISAYSLSVLAWGSLAVSARAGDPLPETRGALVALRGRPLDWSWLGSGTVPLA